MSETESTPCGQCGKPAVAQVSGVPICIDHYTAFLTAQTTLLRHQMAMINYTEQQMASMSGMPWSANQINIPSLPSAPITLNNIRLENSSVGAINTGNVRDIEVNLGRLQNAGSENATKALKVFTEAVIADESISENQKHELLEQIAYLSGQATASAQDRKPAIIKPTLSALSQSATAIGSLATAWQVLGPILQSIFG